MAETFTFEDPNGLSCCMAWQKLLDIVMLGILPALGDVAKLDTLVTVVDGHSMLYELESVQDLKDRGWHATPEDERTVSTLVNANAMTIVGCCRCLNCYVISLSSQT